MAWLDTSAEDVDQETIGEPGIIGRQHQHLTNILQLFNNEIPEVTL